MPDPARWENGEPANLAGAAEDALLWLRTFHRHREAGRVALPQRILGEGTERLGACIRALEQQLEAEETAACEVAYAVGFERGQRAGREASE